VANPLDLGSFIYYVSTLSAPPGCTYERNRLLPPRPATRAHPRPAGASASACPRGRSIAVVVQPSFGPKGSSLRGGRA
jgi:hypothetical protein